MSKRTAAWLAWSLWSISLLLTVALPVISIMFSLSVTQDDTQAAPWLGFTVLLSNLVLLALGALIASRHPQNPIGWIFCANGLVIALGGFTGSYASVQPALPGAQFAAWLSSWTQGPSSFAMYAFLFLLFPDGRVVTPRWRIVAWLAVFAVAVEFFLQAFVPGPLRSYPSINNPFGLEVLGPVADAINTPVFLLLLLAALAGMVSLVIRFRRSSGEEREQLKWFASAAVVTVTAFLAGPVIWFTPAFANTIVWPVLFTVAISVIPLAAAVAILKYRLYSIDILINRTLVYGSLTLTLAVVYFGSVAILEALFRALVGLRNNDLVIVLSTLLIAALFLPLRRGMQEFIDRRFYRRKYDAARTLAAFSQAARDEVDLNALAGRLVQVVDDTMQPEHISLWLKGPSSRR